MKRFITTLLLAGAAWSAQAQVTPTTTFVLTNLPASITTNTTSTLFTAGTVPTANVIAVRQGTGMAVQTVFTGTNAAATGGFSINWAVSLDGTNYSTTNFLQTTNAANGASTVIAVTNFPASLLNNEFYITPYFIQNATTAGNGNVTLQSVTVSFSNHSPGNY